MWLSSLSNPSCTRDILSISNTSWGLFEFILDLLAVSTGLIKTVTLQHRVAKSVDKYVFLKFLVRRGSIIAMQRGLSVPL